MANGGKVISIAALKGGVGKSTITTLVANYLHKNYPEIKIVVVDADDDQNTLIVLRNAEIDYYKANDPDFDESTLYNLVKIDSKLYKYSDESFRNEYDIIFIDFPGNLKQAGVKDTYMFIDHVFIPTATSSLDIDSTIKFIEFFKEDVIKVRKEDFNLDTTIQCFFNRIYKNSTEFKKLYNERHDFIVPFMDSYIPESQATFQKYVSTINSYNNETYQNYEDFCKELLTITVK